MTGFTLMWSKMLDSSVWQTTKEARLLWVTMLLMKDRDGIVRAAKPGLAHRAVLTLKECEAALKVLSDPDPYSTTPDAEGRRLVEIPGGWQIVNHEAYRCSDDRKRDLARLRQEKHRKKQSTVRSPGLTLREKIKRSVAEDPITKADRKEVKRLNGKVVAKAIAPEEVFDGETPFDVA